MRLSLKRWRTLRRDPWRRVFYDSFRRWKAERGEVRRRNMSHLEPESVVFDIGGYQGEWGADLHARYGSSVHVFEPHPRFAAALRARFANEPKIEVHAFALGSTQGRLQLSDEGDASSAVSGALGCVEGEVVDVASFMRGFPTRQVDLAKINIEGGEYDLLPALANAGLLGRFGCIQVQFHLYSESDIGRREAIRESLRDTHSQDWAYPFVWEQWSLKTR